MRRFDEIVTPQVCPFGYEWSTHYGRCAEVTDMSPHCRLDKKWNLLTKTCEDRCGANQEWTWRSDSLGDDGHCVDVPVFDAAFVAECEKQGKVVNKYKKECVEKFHDAWDEGDAIVRDREGNIEDARENKQFPWSAAARRCVK